MYTVTIYVMSWMSIIFKDMLYFKIYVNVYSNYLCYVSDQYDMLSQLMSDIKGGPGDPCSAPTLVNFMTPPEFSLASKVVV